MRPSCSRDFSIFPLISSSWRFAVSRRFSAVSTVSSSAWSRLATATAGRISTSSFSVRTWWRFSCSRTSAVSLSRRRVRRSWVTAGSSRSPERAGLIAPRTGGGCLLGLGVGAGAVQIGLDQLAELIVGEVVALTEHRVADLREHGGLVAAGDESTVVQLPATHPDVELSGGGVLRDHGDRAAGGDALRAMNRAGISQGDVLGGVLGGDLLGALVDATGERHGPVLAQLADRPVLAVGDGVVIAAVVPARGHNVPDMQHGSVTAGGRRRGVELPRLDPGLLDGLVDRLDHLVVARHDGDGLPGAVRGHPRGGCLLGLGGSVGELVHVAVLLEPQGHLVRLLRGAGGAEVAGDLGIGGVCLAGVVLAAEPVDRVQVHAGLVGELRLHQCHRAGVPDRTDLVGVTDQGETRPGVVSNGQ